MPHPLSSGGGEGSVCSHKWIRTGYWKNLIAIMENFRKTALLSFPKHSVHIWVTSVSSGRKHSSERKDQDLHRSAGGIHAVVSQHPGCPHHGFIGDLFVLRMICHRSVTFMASGRGAASSLHSLRIHIFRFLAALWLRLSRKHWLRGLVSDVLRVRSPAFLDAALLRSLSGILLGVTTAPFVRQGIEEMTGESM